MGDRVRAATTETFEGYTHADGDLIPEGSTLGSFKYYSQNGTGIFFAVGEGANACDGNQCIGTNPSVLPVKWLSFTRSDRSAFTLSSIVLWDFSRNGSQYLTIKGFKAGSQVASQNSADSWSTTLPTTTLGAGFALVDSVELLETGSPSAGDALWPYVDDIAWAPALPPTVTTGSSSAIGSAGATVSGTVNANGFSTTDSIQYGTTTAYGTTVVASPATATGAGNTSMSATLAGLSPNTLYHWRVKAASAAGTSTGSDATFTTTKVAQTITFANPGAQNFGTTPTLTATATSGLAVTFASSTTGVCTITSGGALTTVTTGTCTINADQAGNGTYSAAPTVSQNFSVVAVVPGAPTIGTATAGDAQVSVAFTVPSSNGGSAITGYTATSNPGGFTGTGTASPVTVTGLTNGIAYTFTVTATNGAGTGPASTASNSATPLAAQTITFADPGAQDFGTSPTLTATSTSGLAVNFTSGTTGVCTITGGGMLTTVTTGTCTIHADQAGNGTYSAAPTASRSFPVVAVVPGVPTIGAATAGDAQATVAFTTPVTTGGSAITGYTVTSNPGGFTGTGTASPITVTGLTNGTAYTFTVTATNGAGTGPASTASNSATPLAAQTITFADPGTQDFGTSPTLTATATSGLAVTFASSTTGVCTITGGGMLTTVATGTCTIGADQAGNGTYAAAPTASRSFPVVAVVPDAPTIGTATAGDVQVAVSFAAPAFTGGAAITGYTVTSNPGGFTGTGASSPISVTGLTNGTAYTFTVTATNAAGTGAASAASNSATPRGSQTITFADPGPQTLGTTPALGATASSSLPVSFSSSTSGVCTITSGGALTTVSTGTCTINADQSGNAAYTAAPTVTRSFAIEPSTRLSSRPVRTAVSGEPEARVGHVFAFAPREVGSPRLGMSSCSDEASCLSVEVVLPEASTVSVAIFDNLGTFVVGFDQEVSARDLRNRVPTGDGRWSLPVSWNLRASDGTPVVPGVYLWKIEVLTESGRKLEAVKRLGVR
jgi:hypothetical protein